MMGDSFNCWAIKPSTNAPANPPVKVSRTLSSCIVAPRDESPNRATAFIVDHADMRWRPRMHGIISEQGENARVYVLEKVVGARVCALITILQSPTPNT